MATHAITFGSLRGVGPLTRAHAEIAAFLGAGIVDLVVAYTWTCTCGATGMQVDREFAIHEAHAHARIVRGDQPS